MDIQPGQSACIPLNIAIAVPPGTFAQIAPTSSAVNKRVDVKAGIVDFDLTGNATVILQNNGDDHYQINKGDVIAQLLLLNILTP